MSKKKDTNSDLKGNKRFRRKWITWMRMVRYGANNFTRNLWLTTAATVVMAITLLIIFATYVSSNVLNDTVADIRQRVDIPINLKSSLSEKKIQELKKKFEAQPDVTSVNYVSAEESKQNLLNSGKLSAKDLETIAQLPEQPYYPILKLVVKDPSNTTELAKFVKDDKDIQESLIANPALRPTFSGERSRSIQTISGWASTAEKGGLAAGVIFVAISMLIIFNTIRMAIFSRKDEIEMMKLIGADKGFIRGPFVIEAVMYGFFAALIATATGISVFLAVEPKLSSYGVSTTALHENLVMFSPLVLIIMIAIGALIGIISARLAVRRYLK